MKRAATYICLLFCAVVVPSVAVAANTTSVQGMAKGQITWIGRTNLTIQTGGRLGGVINVMTAAANTFARRGYPYVWGGGHNAAGFASIGVRGGPGFDGHRQGFDCSGAVAAVMSSAGVWPAGSGVPNDAGVISYLLGQGVIAPGPGTAPNEVTLYDHPGAHIFMNINGRFFGTSDGGHGNPSGSPTWLDDGAPDAVSQKFKRYHVLASVLKNRASYGHFFSFQIGKHPKLLLGAEVGDTVRVSYAGTRTGAIAPTAVTYVGAATQLGTVIAIAADRSSMTIQTGTGKTLTFATSLVPSLVDPLQTGDGIQVTYSTDPLKRLIPHAVTVVSVPTPPAPPTTPTPPPPVPPILPSPTTTTTPPTTTPTRPAPTPTTPTPTTPTTTRAGQ